MTATSTPNGAPATTPGTVARAIQLLRAIAEAGEDVTVAGLADTVGLPRPTVHRLLGLLRDEGMVDARPGRAYGAGPEFVRIAALISKRHGLTKLARPFMERVARTTGECCMLCVFLPAQRRMVIADDVASVHQLGYRIEHNTPMSVLWGASGKAILAYLPEATRRAVVADEEPSPVTAEPVPSVEAIEAEMAVVRSRGWAYTQGQKIPGSRGIAAPIRGGDGVAVGSLALTIPELRFRADVKDELGATVAEHASELSRLLGHEGAA